MKQTVTCAACSGTGWWHAGATRGIGNVYYERQRLPCINCDGIGRVTCDVDSTEDKAKRMSDVASEWWGSRDGTLEKKKRSR